MYIVIIDNEGQITIDYLISITMFLFAVVFVFNYTSGIFTPFQSNSDEVTLIADGGSYPVNYDDSTLTLYYDGMPGSITYLLVSRNDLSATLN
ncbi:hypothetical protein [uncultured Methanolobus sp.]|uniref:DUF7287 family protein n=1 Tax=uncultured Methanolobus sp. TaxID=218300 RepID=UPI0029C86FCD|nr:hypothetical protein [uncultured Methanolobus sp.]